MGAVKGDAEEMLLPAVPVVPNKGQKLLGCVNGAGGGPHSASAELPGGDNLGGLCGPKAGNGGQLPVLRLSFEMVEIVQQTQRDGLDPVAPGA